MLLAERIAAEAMQHFEKEIPKKGKPKAQSEWTVYAAIIASVGIPHKEDGGDDDAQIHVLSAATGTKCTNQKKSGLILADCHAEVLARRGFVRLLFAEILHTLKTNKHQNDTISTDRNRSTVFPLLKVAQGKKDCTKFALKENIQLHLYVSDSPCGDGSIYPIGNETDAQDELQYTGAKVILSDETGVNARACGGEHLILDGTSVAREAVQVLGALRTKSGRSNLPAHLRSCSMSCSDKIVQWGLLGLGGGLLSRWIEEPIGLSSIVVDLDPRTMTTGSKQMEALQRALPDRIKAAQIYMAKKLDELHQNLPKYLEIPAPSVHVVQNACFPNGKAIMTAKIGSETNTSPSDLSSRKRKRTDDGTKISPSGIAFDWQLCLPCNTATATNQRRIQDGFELLVGARGIRQGKKPKSIADFQNMASRLSRRELWKLARACLDAEQEINPRSLAQVNSKQTYQQFKVMHADKDFQTAKSIIFDGGPLKGWLQSRDANDFCWTIDVEEDNK